MQILFLIFFSFGCFLHIFTVENQLPGFSISGLANVEDFLNVNFLIVNMNVIMKIFSFKCIFVVCYLKFCFY